MRKRFVSFVLAAAFGAVSIVAAPAVAEHNTGYCNAYDGRSTIIEIGAPGNSLFYIHDRSSVPGTGLIAETAGLDPHAAGTWMFMESGVQPRLQTGGEAIVFPLNDLGSADPCTKTAASDPVIF